MKKEYRSFHEKLKMLPDFFSINTACKILALPRQSVRNDLSSWTKKNYLEPFGPKCGLYFNTYKNPRSKKDFWHNALLELYPDAVFCGVNVLRSASWMTQISRKSEIIVRKRPVYMEISDVELMPRSKAWYKRYWPGIRDEEGKKSLLPEYALVDMCEQNKYIPDPDDLFLEDEDVEKIKKAFSDLKVDIPEKLHDVLEHCPEEKKDVAPKKRNMLR